MTVSAQPANLRPALLLTVAALLVQVAALLVVGQLRGQVDAYAFTSPDAAEYVALARGLVTRGHYVSVDAQGHAADRPDTWRTPGYPLFLAAVMLIDGDHDLSLVIHQQIVAALTVPLLFLLIGRHAPRRLAFLAAGLWMIDPFRVYYSQWLLAGTLFVFMLLLAAHAWEWFIHERNTLTAFMLGLATAACVLVRPIGIALPALAVLGITLSTWHRGWPRATRLAAVGIAGIVLVIGPWLVRNKVVAGHAALAHQGGASFAYHRVLDVVLWSEGRPDERFSAETHEEIRRRVDRRLQQKWQQRFGPLTDDQRADLTWHRLNFGTARTIDPFVASELLWEVGLEMLHGRTWAIMPCFAAQGLGMLVFPLGLVLFPPATAGPMSMLLGGNTAVATAFAVLLGSVYALLTLGVLIRMAQALARRARGAHVAYILPAMTLFVLALPFEDPRFRLPLVPFMWLIAAAPLSPRSATQCPSRSTVPFA